VRVCLCDYQNDVTLLCTGCHFFALTVKYCIRPGHLHGVERYNGSTCRVGLSDVSLLQLLYMDELMITIMKRP